MRARERVSERGRKKRGGLERQVRETVAERGAGAKLILTLWQSRRNNKPTQTGGESLMAALVDMGIRHCASLKLNRKFISI